MVIPVLSMHPVLKRTCKTDFYAVFKFIKVIMTKDYKTKFKVKSLYMFIHAVLENRIKTRSYEDSVRDSHTEDARPVQETQIPSTSLSSQWEDGDAQGLSQE